VADQHPAIVEIEQQILRPPAQRRDPAALDESAEADGKRDAQVRPALVDLDDAAALEHRLEAAADGFDFGKLRHGATLQPSGLAGNRRRSAVPSPPLSPYGPPAMARPDEIDHATRFGERRVAEDEKGSLVRAVFRSVAPRYDLMNDLMSAGVHRLWKSAMAAKVADGPRGLAVDVAGGTGDIAFRLRERGYEVVVVDINDAMVAVGRDRALDRAIIEGIAWSCGDAEALPLRDSSVEAYTIAFGIRNVTHLSQALAEARRVLKPGGRFACLEFGHVVVPALAGLYERYSDVVLPRLGAMVAGDAYSYRYLVESIRRFPEQKLFAAMVADAGLAHVATTNLSGGIAALTTAWRL